MEHITAEFLPSKLLRGISKANGLSAWPTTGKCKFVSAMASSTDMYSSDNVHVSTFYVKTAHVGKHNNSIPLSDEESIYYNMDFTN
eukprot:scaffold76613_cov30-Attheya_sp.AAC.2